MAEKYSAKETNIRILELEFFDNGIRCNDSEGNPYYVKKLNDVLIQFGDRTICLSQGDADMLTRIVKLIINE